MRRAMRQPSRFGPRLALGDSDPAKTPPVSQILTLVSPLMRMGSCAAALYAGGRRAGEAAPIEIELDGGMRLCVDAASMRKR
jgi:hypothetical protein